MARPEYPPLTPDELSQLDSAVAFWAERHPLPEYPAFAFAGEEPFSPLELAESLRLREGEIADRFIRMARFALETETLDGLLERFYQAGEAGITVT